MRLRRALVPSTAHVALPALVCIPPLPGPSASSNSISISFQSSSMPSKRAGPRARATVEKSPPQKSRRSKRLQKNQEPRTAQTALNGASGAAPKDEAEAAPSVRASTNIELLVAAATAHFANRRRTAAEFLPVEHEVARTLVETLHIPFHLPPLVFHAAHAGMGSSATSAGTLADTQRAQTPSGVRPATPSDAPRPPSRSSSPSLDEPSTPRSPSPQTVFHALPTTRFGESSAPALKRKRDSEADEVGPSSPRKTRLLELPLSEGYCRVDCAGEMAVWDERRGERLVAVLTYMYSWTVFDITLAWWTTVDNHTQMANKKNLNRRRGKATCTPSTSMGQPWTAGEQQEVLAEAMPIYKRLVGLQESTASLNAPPRQPAVPGPADGKPLPSDPLGLLTAVAMMLDGPPQAGSVQPGGRTATKRKRAAEEGEGQVGPPAKRRTTTRVGSIKPPGHYRRANIGGS
ncbi:uncharacterized protein BXZ73DRAFT_77092 [Epithele typhae]|uniref:uncharacterized protein n=1 Tax=Epithele typhae TaxID=378194 RepID=UPI0020084118|nr:uncharacterized protein BXZ73DRAFT_77092 [Epithele typhae]KAH9933981.1 hypothetical protein BXZ73DRAFT_77092 [Epithele typhae]